MKNILKYLTIAIAAGIVLVAIYAALNWQNLMRLKRVNSLFDEDKIVYNFSHMNELLFADHLPRSGPVHDWPIDLKPLPETFTFEGKTLNVKEILDETQTTAFVVVKDGTIVFEEYYKGTGQDDLRISWSMAKSFASALLGIAYKDGLIENLDDPVTKYVPALKGTGYDGASIRNVLHMASGVTFDEDYMDRGSDINKMGRALALGSSLDEFAASVMETSRAPGTARQYVSIDTHVVAMVLRSATGETLQDYFVKNLWSQIGAGADAFYSTDGLGNAFALGGLNIRTRDYALFGELFREGGRSKPDVGGRQIIPADWVAESTENSAPADVFRAPFGYGYQWWLPPGAEERGEGEFIAGGIYGQFIYVNRARGVTIAKNAAHRAFMADGSGAWVKARNFEMFRAIAEHY